MTAIQVTNANTVLQGGLSLPLPLPWEDRVKEIESQLGNGVFNNAEEELNALRTVANIYDLWEAMDDAEIRSRMETEFPRESRRKCQTRIQELEGKDPDYTRLATLRTLLNKAVTELELLQESEDQNEGDDSEGDVLRTRVENLRHILLNYKYDC